MLIIKSPAQLAIQLNRLRAGNRVGFVPTMGALHKGHISLIESCRQKCDVCVSSIFVNPTQFNNAKDFETYPQTLAADIEQLENAGCDVLFIPEVDDMYPPGDTKPSPYPVHGLDLVLEGKFRPGHYQGVLMIVDKLLKLVMPDVLFLGKKDHQQCLVIHTLLESKYPETEMCIVPTRREKSGLAMSSRNARLSASQLEDATVIYKSLRNMSAALKTGETASLAEQAVQQLESAGLQVDYVSIANTQTLKPVTNWDGKEAVTALIAAFVGEVRLIDNLDLYPVQEG